MLSPSEKLESTRSASSVIEVDKFPPLWQRRLRPILDRPPGTLMIHEIYRSLQGEGTHAGLPCLFVRLTGCHLRCGYCDSPHAFTQGTPWKIEDVITQVLLHADPLVQVTGGEPLLQDEVYPLMAALADAGKTILLETSGCIDAAKVDPRVRIIYDVKTPASGEHEANHWPNFERLKPGDEVKFIVCDHQDFQWSLKIIDQFDLTSQVPVLISPSYGQIDLEQLAQWVLDSRRQLRLQIQLHKILWGAARRGV